MGNKKVVGIGVFSTILVAMVVIMAVIVTRNRGMTPEGLAASVSSKAVEIICAPTDFKEACVSTLSQAKTVDTKELIKLALRAAKDKISQSLQNSTILEKFHMDPRTSQAFDICNEALDSAMDSLQDTLDALGTFEWSKIGEHVNDLQTWLTTSFSYSTICLDAFEDNSTTTVDAKMEMTKITESARQFTNNALVMINQFQKLASVLPFPKGSHTFSKNDGFPKWVNEGHKKLLTLPGNMIQANTTVALDGSGNFTTLSEALENVLERKDDSMYIIYIKAGVYQDYIEIGKRMKNIMVIGDGPTKTKFTGRRNFVEGFGTFKTGTFRALGPGFIAKDMGFENTAGAENHQAVALHVGGDMSVIYNCQIDGYQDTLLTAVNRQFYKNCTISGTVDFIFGYGSVVFQDCTMLIRKPLENQQCMLTADGRDNAHLTSGIVIQNSHIMAAPDMFEAKNNFSSYLGRPWKPLARTIIMNSVIDDVIHPDGWKPWGADLHTDTCFYAEFNNTGPGADLGKRVPWVKTIDVEHAVEFSVARFINGDKWIPNSGVSFVPGILA